MPAAQQRGQRSSDRASSRTLEAFWLANEVYPFVPGVESLFSAAVVGGVSQHNAAGNRPRAARSRTSKICRLLQHTLHVLEVPCVARPASSVSWRPGASGTTESAARQRSLTGDTGGGPRRLRKFWFFYTYGTVGERPLGNLLQSLRTTAVTFTSDFPQYLGRAQW